MAHDMITVRRDDIENTLDWWSAGDLPDEDTIGRLHAAFKAQPTPEQRLAEGIIGELVSEAEFGDIGDRLEDHAEGLAAIDFDQLHRNVADLISKATVTVTWPQDAEQAGGDA